MNFIYGQTSEEDLPCWFVQIDSDRAQVWASNILVNLNKGTDALDMLFQNIRGSYMNKNGNIVNGVPIVHGKKKDNNWPDEKSSDIKFRKVVL
jgi:hypothetical protein